MTRVVRNAALLCVGGVLLASAAMANVPDPGHSTFQSAYIAVEGKDLTGQPDNCSDGRCANWTITVRDFANNLIAGSTVVLDFSGCVDIQVSCDQLNALTGQTDLAGKKVAGVTGATGTFTFKVQGAGAALPPTAQSTCPACLQPPGSAKVGVPCGQVFADGVPMGSLIVSAYDLNGLGSGTNSAVNSADAGLLSAELLHIGGLPNAEQKARDDYNFTNSVNAGDAGIMSGMILNAFAVTPTGTRSTGTYCP